MPHGEEVMKRLSTFFTTLTLNITLLTVSVFWLAGQFSIIIGWVAIGGTEHSVRIDREGWMWQQMPSQRGRRIGVIARDYRPHRFGLWEDVLSDGDLTRPLPGVLHYHASGAGGASFVRIVAVRHWLVFLLTFGTWCAWRIALRRWLMPRDKTCRESVAS